MAEKEQKSRLSRSVMGQWMAFVVVLIGLVGGMGLVYYNKQIEGLAVILGSLALLAGPFLSLKWLSRKQPPAKSSIPAPPE